MPQTSKTSVAAKRILIAEDEAPMAKALSLKLTGAGYEVTTVSNGKEALDAVVKQQFDLILSDLIMPIIDGFALLQELRNRKVAVPVIVLSNLGQQEDQAKVKELGAIAYFVKANTPLSTIIDYVNKVFSA